MYISAQFYCTSISFYLQYQLYLCIWHTIRLNMYVACKSVANSS